MEENIFDCRMLFNDMCSHSNDVGISCNFSNTGVCYTSVLNGWKFLWPDSIFTISKIDAGHTVTHKLVAGINFHDCRKFLKVGLKNFQPCDIIIIHVYFFNSYFIFQVTALTDLFV